MCSSPLRSPAWEGALNLHHIGGDVYRMGRHERLTAAGWRHAHRDGVRTVVDLRAPAERRRRDTDPVLSRGAMDGITVIDAATEDPDHPEFRRLMVPYLDHPADYRDYLRLFPERVAAAFRHISVARGAVVVHCSAGRDRTGLVSAMLQQLAGTDRAEILDGYEAAVRGANAHLLTLPTPHPHERWYPDAELAARIVERRDALAGFLDGIDTSVWLTNAGVVRADVDRLIDRLR